MHHTLEIHRRNETKWWCARNIVMLATILVEQHFTFYGSWERERSNEKLSNCEAFYRRTVIAFWANEFLVFSFHNFLAQAIPFLYGTIWIIWNGTFYHLINHRNKLIYRNFSFKIHLPKMREKNTCHFRWKVANVSWLLWYPFSSVNTEPLINDWLTYTCTHNRCLSLSLDGRMLCMCL